MRAALTCTIWSIENKWVTKKKMHQIAFFQATQLQFLNWFLCWDASWDFLCWPHISKTSGGLCSPAAVTCTMYHICNRAQLAGYDLITWCDNTCRGNICINGNTTCFTWKKPSGVDRNVSLLLRILTYIWQMLAEHLVPTGSLFCPMCLPTCEVTLVSEAHAVMCDS